MNMTIDELKNYPMPRVIPLPKWSKAAENSVICLDGSWKVTDKKDGAVQQVQVPFDMGILHKKGLSQHYSYERKIQLPKREENSRIVLKFQGINGFATVYVDGKQVAYHENGFITWNVDITEEVCGKQTFSLAIDVDEEADIVSAYSHGGMLHSSWLYVLPEAYVNALYLSPLFDEDMETCSLRVDMDLADMPGSIDKKGKIQSAKMAAGKEKGRLAGNAVYKAEFVLYDPNGIKTKEKSLVLDNKIKGYYTDQLYVANPVLWDAEHPRLYRFELTLYKLDSISGTWELLEKAEKKVGLRKLERKGNRLFVNHNEVKLRGVCRHEISPRNGRALTNELIEQDVALFKEANCNYIRTSHYPPSEYFLDQCDEHGIYVEDELALAFIARTLPYTQRDPKETNRYLSHFAETMARDYNHPCVIIWSLCNESFGGHNFDLLNRFAHLKDPTRMTKFSYPMTIREEHEMPDIWSIHYSEYNADLAGKKDNLSVGGAPGKDMPVLHDEYVHVACYNREEMRRDPNIRSYWGESIRIFWDNIWNTQGALGGAIWAGIDETDLYDGGNGQMEWGIIDVWRRKKPEFYMTRKAYSPIKVIHSEVKAQEKKVLLIIENRFCHTNLNEVKVQWKCGDENGIWKLPECAPGKVIKVLLSLENAEDQSPVTLEFLDGNDCQIDEMKVFSRDYVEAPLFELSADETENIKALKIHKENQEVFITGNDFKFSFNVKTGLLTGGWARQNNKILVGGPILNVPYLKLGAWYMTSFAVKEKQNFVEVRIQGGYEKTLSIEWIIEIQNDGTFYTTYQILHLEKHLPKQIKLRVGVDCGGLDELGIAYILDPSVDTLSWRRNMDPDQEGRISLYPKDHISRNQGTAKRFTRSNIWGEMPVTSWGEDMRDDILFGRYDGEYHGSNDFKSTKEDVAEAYVYNENRTKIQNAFNGEKDAGKIGMLKIFGTQKKSDQNGKREVSKANIRLEVLDPKEEKILESDSRIAYTGTWYQVMDKKESDHGTEMWSREKGAALTCKFQGTGILWYGPQDPAFGMADVYVDGEKKASHISKRSAGVDFSCCSAGYDKCYHLPIFSIKDLPYGEHTIRIEVCGEKAEDATDCYIVLDYLRVLGTSHTEPVKLMINQDFSYPHISWGNVRKPPLVMRDGTCGTVKMKMCAVTKTCQVDK